jgi:hypothetical protein
MTTDDWAQYITSFVPSTRAEAETYLNDLLAYSKTGNFESGIARCRANPLFVDYPDLDATILQKIRFNNKFEQSNLAIRQQRENF